MKTTFYSLSIILLILFVVNNSFGQQHDFTGNWSGKIRIPTGELEMIFKITSTDGKYEAKLDVPKQGAANLPVGEVQVIGDSVKIAVPAIHGDYSGQFSAPDSVTGKWKQNGMSFDVNLKRIGEVAAPVRPQMPVPPFPYLSEEVEYTNPKSGLKLAGTLTLPKDTKSCPAVVLITGSGAQDRNETIFGHQPFAVIADYLTRNGIAVLRVDDRGVGGSEGDVSSSTSVDFAGDVLAGVAFLKNKKEIDPKKIGLIGHSEGGLIAPLVASMSKDVAFIVMMAGPGVTGEQILYEQTALISKVAGLSDATIEQNNLAQKKIFEVVKNETDSALTVSKLREVLAQENYDELNEDQKNAQITTANSKWFRFFLTYDPVPTLEKVKCPVLAINGTLDLQVPVSNLEVIKNALAKGGNKNVTIIPFEDHNHLFQKCETGSVNEYFRIEQTIDPEVLKTMKDWILKTTSK